MTTRFAMAAAVLLAGCSEGDPELFRLKTGDRALAAFNPAMFRGPEHRDDQQLIPLVQSRDPDSDEIVPWPMLSPGTRILVIRDEAKGDDVITRGVDVKVEDGEFAGQTGMMCRGQLRPIR